MITSRAYHVLLFITVATYFTASKYLFDKVYQAQKVVVDELFHLPQGIQYCRGNYAFWHPKITTPPGLYVVSAIFLNSFFDCNEYNLRFTNLIASTINLLLFASIIKFIYNNTALKTVLHSLNFAILPPLYFFSHVYYTDTLSVTFLLLYSRLCLTRSYKFTIFVVAILSIIMRQTNIVWIGMVFAHKFLEVFIRTSRVVSNKYVSESRSLKAHIHEYDHTKLKRYYDMNDLWLAYKFHTEDNFTVYIRNLSNADLINFSSHMVIFFSFIFFVIIYGSISLGDAHVHVITIHTTQIFYFLLFYGVFALPYVLKQLKVTIKLIFNNKSNVVLLTALFLFLAHYNTVSHPYMLADNRHFTFYIWNRWYGKYWYARYVSVPAYVFLMASLYTNLIDQNCISFWIPFSFCALVVIGLQRMIEVRYFLVPFIVMKLRFPKPTLFILLVELVWYSAINIAAFYVFFGKEFSWSDFEEPQRIIW